MASPSRKADWWAMSNFFQDWGGSDVNELMSFRKFDKAKAMKAFWHLGINAPENAYRGQRRWRSGSAC